MLFKQQIHQRSNLDGPCVQIETIFWFFDIADRIRTVSRRSELKSRTILMDEQSNPWKRLHLQDMAIQHRGGKHPHR